MRYILGLTDRTLEVAEHWPRGAYIDHATHSLSCGCSLVEPDKDCDRGEALHRMSTRTLPPVLAVVFIDEMRAPPRTRAPR